MKRRLFAAVVLVLSGVLFATGTARGAGFALIEQSVSGLGNAFAGGAAAAEDATTLFFNPAGAARLNGTQLVIEGTLVAPSVSFRNEGSTHVLQQVTGAPLSGNDGGNAGVAKVIPNFYLSRKLSDRVVVGLGVNAPFGLTTEYDNGWVGRYHALNSEMMTVNINPSVSYKVTDRFSIGGGISIQRIDAELSNAIDYGTLDAAGAFKGLGLAAGALKLVPQHSDGLVSLKGDNWALGYNLGLLYQFNDATRMGIAYRSRVKHTLEGDAVFSNTPAGLSPYPVFKNSGIKADTTLPDTLSVSLYHGVTPEWAIMADATWTNWSLFKELRIRFDNPYQADSVTTVSWKDSMRYSTGVTYSPKDPWVLRAGVAYDTTPVPDDQHRTPRIPDEDRIWTAFGLGYRISNLVKVDAGYAHLFVSDPKVDKSPTGEDQSRGGLKGTYKAHVDIVGLQIAVQF